jgi:hypothetical protein
MTNEPIDVAAFVAQLADDEHLGRELAGMAEIEPAPNSASSTRPNCARRSPCSSCPTQRPGWAR